MHHFSYLKGELFCEEVPVKKIAREVGTPFYLYSAKTFRRHFKAFQNAFSDINHIVCFAVKANSNLSVLSLLAQQGSGADIVSRGELFRAIKAGIPANRIVYSGVGKRPDEIKYALEQGILMFNVESIPELKCIAEQATGLGVKANISFRVNPDVDPKTHPYISTGLKKNKFGLAIREAEAAYDMAAQIDSLNIIGIDCHIGSQLTQINPFVDALLRLLNLLDRLKQKGHQIKYLDIGGGLGIHYHDEAPPEPDDYAKALLTHLKDRDQTLILEPGRAIAGNAGILVTELLYIKDSPEKCFYIVDAGMNDLARPSLYQAYHEIIPVEQTNNSSTIIADIVGPICETGDFLAKDRQMPVLKQGALLAVMSAGAYGFTMSSNYNSRPRVAEVMVDGSEFRIVRERETLEDLISKEL